MCANLHMKQVSSSDLHLFSQYSLFIKNLALVAIKKKLASSHYVGHNQKGLPIVRF